MAKQPKRKWNELDPQLTAETHPDVPSIDDYERQHSAEDTDHARLPLDRLMRRALRR